MNEFAQQIADHAEKLAKLMRDPQPGLFTWSEFVRQHAQWLSDWWAGKFAEQEVTK